MSIEGALCGECCGVLVSYRKSCMLFDRIGSCEMGAVVEGKKCEEYAAGGH